MAAAGRRRPEHPVRREQEADRAMVGGVGGQAVISAQALCDLPDVSIGILETGGAHAPWSIHGSVQQLDAALAQLAADRIDVGNLDGELNSSASPLFTWLCWTDQPPGSGQREQIDEHLAELE